ncbi:Glutamine-rich protein [Ooceraea biroi]|uniref:Glutamine-rich protein n=1 Tax=Ooceraea biroi TaxID=2015173 RepID=A0A026WJM9_OOCBI|nr:Glutamine-rich protein [Ooceraea biroi]
MPAQEVSAANIDVVSLQLSLPQMLDLALGTPEIGVVNFNILHNFLHVLLHQINLRAAKVEYRGEHADRIKTMVTSSKLEPTLQLHEYSITDGTGKVSQRMREDDGLEVEVFTEDTPLATVDTVKVTKGMRQQMGPEKVGEAETVIVKQLQQQYQALEELSGTPEVIERLKGRLTDPVADVWQFININKRLDASEQGIDKLTTMVQDVMKGDSGVITMLDTSLIDTRLNELKDKVSKIEQRCTCNQVEGRRQEITKVLTEDAQPTVGTDVAANAAEAMEPTVVAVAERAVAEAEAAAAIAEEVEAAAAAEMAATDAGIVPVHEKEERAGEIPRVVAEKPADHPVFVDNTEIIQIRQDVDTLKTDVARMQQELNDLKEKVLQIESPVKTPPRMKAPVETVVGAPVETVVGAPVEMIVGAPLMPERPSAAETITDLERMIEVSDVTNLEQYMDVVKNVATTHGKVLNEITEDMVALENEIRLLSEKMDDVQATDKAHDSDIDRLHTKMQEIQMNMKKLEESTDNLLDDKEKRETHINELLEQIEVLKTVKADKEDLEDALAEKADAQTVNRKVSHDQFDAACEDLARGLEEAIDKLTKQESIWQQALDEVQNEIAGKADRGEMMPLKDFVNNKLKSLQEKLKSMIEAKREIEAAGTKKLLRDVQCISCDKDVVMKTEEVAKFRTDPLPCTTSMKPYLTYELDQVRKQQRRLPHSRNMIQFEAAMQDETRKIKTAREETLAKTPRNHLCNRYCGGSHTITTPQQRVIRVGHFLSQWGPEVVQLTDGLIRGKDRQTYRSRLMSGKLDVCGPACWESQSSEEARLTVTMNAIVINNSSAHFVSPTIVFLSLKSLRNVRRLLPRRFVKLLFHPGETTDLVSEQHYFIFSNLYSRGIYSPSLTGNRGII